MLDFSTIMKKNICENYLIFIQLLCISAKVAKKFSKLYSNFNQETLLNTGITTIAVRRVSEICYKGVKVGNIKESTKTISVKDYSDLSRDFESGGRSSGESSKEGFR